MALAYGLGKILPDHRARPTEQHREAEPHEEHLRWVHPGAYPQQQKIPTSDGHSSFRRSPVIWHRHKVVVCWPPLNYRPSVVTGLVADHTGISVHDKRSLD